MELPLTEMEKTAEKYDYREKSVRFGVVKSEITTWHQSGDVKKAIRRVGLQL